MSSPAASEREFHAHRVPPVSRLIPGLAFPPVTAPRKKPQSVTWDRHHWAGEALEPLPTPEVVTTAAALRQAILPTPAETRQRYHLLTQVTPDFLMAAVSVEIAATLLRTMGAAFSPVSRPSAAILYAALLTLLAYSEGLYRTDVPQDLEPVLLGKALAWATLLAALTLPLQSAIAPAASGPFIFFGLLGWRLWQRHARASRAVLRNVLIVGAGQCGRHVATQLSHERYAVCGFLDDAEPIASDVLGRTRDLARVARAEFIDEVILAGISPQVAHRIIHEAHHNRLDVKVVPECLDLPAQPVAMEHFGDTALFTLHEEPVPGGGLLIKRAVDIALSSLAIVFTAPLLAVIALLIKLDSSGPVFYRAPRIGKKGREFLCYKFRTMIADAEVLKERLRANNEREGAFFKIASDPRITRLGRFLRRYSFDELPQLMNVLKGEMSLVGPRPHPLDDCARYQLGDLRRLDVVPGLTGLWQITARNDPSFERNMALDLEYIERWSLWLDLQILCRTAWVVVRGNGA